MQSYKDVSMETNREFDLKCLADWIESLKGMGTSLISLYIPPTKTLTDVTKMLNEQIVKAASIKSAANRKSVISSLKSICEKLKLYRQTPNNGLVIFSGEISEKDSKTDRKFSTQCIEPPKPISSNCYHCSNKFYVDPLRELIIPDEEATAYIIIDGKSALFATLQGKNKQILKHIEIELQKQHSKGGQSAPRFSRLAEESRQNYVKKVAELATKLFFSQERSTIKGLVIGGSADLKNDLAESEDLDARLKSRILEVVRTKEGGEVGLNQAIELSQKSLANSKYTKEKKALEAFFAHVDRCSNSIAFGVKDALQALEMGAVATLFLHEEAELKDLTDAKKNKREESIREWILDNYQDYGAELLTISSNFAEGAQFMRSYGGIGAILRYKIDFESIQDCESGNESTGDEESE